MVRGSVVLVGLAVAVGLFFLAVAWVGLSVRQDFHVLSRGDTERTAWDLDAARAVWSERVPFKTGAVLAYDLEAKRRTTLEAANVSLHQPVALDGRWAAWVEAFDGSMRVRVWDFEAQQGFFVGPPGGNTTLPGRTLQGDTLLVTSDGAPHLARLAPGGATLEPVKLLSAPSVLTGEVVDWAQLDPRPPLVVEAGRAWWAHGPTLHAWDARTRSALPSLGAGGPVVSLDADADLLAWAEERGGERRVHYQWLANGTRGEATAFPGPTHSPAVNGSRVAFVQADGLVRLKDLATGEERVMAARTPENRALRLTADWVGWLSGTIEGHNVVIVPAGTAGFRAES